MIDLDAIERRELAVLKYKQASYTDPSHEDCLTLIGEIRSLQGHLRRVELANSKMGVREHEFNKTLTTFHTTPEFHQYECIGYSEGQECCATQLQEELARQQKISGG